jgi:hypothetical protein
MAGNKLLLEIRQHAELVQRMYLYVWFCCELCDIVLLSVFTNKARLNHYIGNEASTNLQERLKKE